jgi:signal transduction histidine kinase
VRLGIRLQLLLALGSLLVLAFVPLFVAVVNLTEATLSGVREGHARALGRAIAGHVGEARRARGEGALAELLDAQVGEGGVAAIGLYDASGALAQRAAEPGVEALLPREAPARVEMAEPRRTPAGPAVLVVVPGGASSGPIAVVVRADRRAASTAPLVGLVALYTALVALALLVFAYGSLTRLVVRPVIALSSAARRVADGGRRFEAPAAGARELVELGSSVAAMTERLRADEESLRDKVAALERARAELVSAQDGLVRSERLASVGRLAAGLAHEIGNPIAAILGFQELLLQGGFTPTEEREFLEHMRRETERVSRILRDLLDFARPAAAQAKAREAPGSAADAIADVLALVKPQKAFRRLALEVDVAPGLPPVSLAHPRLVQVLLNLLLNAADAVRADGGRVGVRASATPGGVRVDVDDDGPGIDPAVGARLFEPFVTTKEVGKGTGLGLAVCRGLIEAAGGAIAAERSPLGGARFTIDLPAARVTDA